MRCMLLFLAVVGPGYTQISTALLDRLDSKDVSVRQAAVEELGTLDPSSQVSGRVLASKLVEVLLKEESVVVRQRVAAFLAAPRPAEIAVPGLLQALGRMDRDFERARKSVSALDPSRSGPGSGAVMGADLAGVLGFADAILASLEGHDEERAVTGVAEIVKAWKFDRVAGATIQSACRSLCCRGTFPALEAVGDTLVRGRAFIDSGRPDVASPPPDKAAIKPTGVLVQMSLRPFGKKDVDEIVDQLERALIRAGVTKPPTFDSSKATAWRDLVKANLAKIPRRLADLRPASKPATDSNPSKSN
jgi:hypothetical protein